MEREFAKQRKKDFLRKNEYGLTEYVLRDGKKHPFALLIPGAVFTLYAAIMKALPLQENSMNGVTLPLCSTIAAEKRLCSPQRRRMWRGR